MQNISNIIEEHLKQILNASRQGYIEIRRSDIADQFNCVPSQINYVISTRFTPERGYVVESKRGGGGYIRIRRLGFERTDALAEKLIAIIGGSITQREAEGIIYRLVDEQLINRRESFILLAAIDRNVLTIGLPVRDQLRAAILSAMLMTVF
ncbi:MAG: CtsR family transcriptional regulator [Bacilli bacterium]|nr:CtsR family transcriptional regulator [Bacilli bacterium]